MNYALKIFLPLFFLTLIFVPVFAQAQGGILPECGGVGQDECGFNDLIILINNIIDELIKYSIVVAAAVFSWAGFKMMTNPDNPGTRKESLDMIKKVFIGLAIVLSAWLITETLATALLKEGYTNIIDR